MPLICDIKVIPRSSSARCIIAKGGTLTCYLKSAPEQNKANIELINLIAKAVKISQTHITIIMGATSRKKRIKIDAAITISELYAALGIEQQHTLF